jgi:predicted nucleotidyltransferase
MKAKPNTIILEGITGSKAYGLDTEDSDTDIEGVYVAPTSEVLGIKGIAETIDHTDPDWTYHELGKFISLAMRCNPTLLELLFLEGYTQQTKFGHMLVDNRHLFLSTIVYKSYGGYAVNQARKLNARGGTFGNGRNNRYSKHARHCFRLLYQGKQLLETGNLTVRVDQQTRQQLFEIGELPVTELVDLFEREFKKFDRIKTVLPDKPDIEGINKMLLKIRKANW